MHNNKDLAFEMSRFNTTKVRTGGLLEILDYIAGSVSYAHLGDDS